MLRDYFRKKLKDPLIALLGQGMSPEKLALSLACGATLGLFPVLGTTTILCLAFALFFRLNTPAAVMANWAVYPLQIALIPPFFMTGGYLFGAGLLIHPAYRIAPLSTSDLVQGAGFLAGSTLHAILVWGMLAPFSVAILHFSLLPVLRRLSSILDKT
jgi:uncharacterized protein (DUF2062 family)